MKIKIGLLTLVMTTTLAADALAAEIEKTCFTPVRGNAQTMCIPEFDSNGNLLQPCPEMLGQFRLVLKELSDERQPQRLRIAGPLHGVVNPDQTLNHVMGDNQANGLLYTSGDTLIEVTPISECLVQITEVLYVTNGTGKYSGAQGTITISGELNICTGVNELDIKRGDDQLCFDTATFNPEVSD